MNDPHPPLVVQVDGFTRPGEADSAPGIRAAIRHACATGAAMLRFAAGTYRLRSAEEHPAAGAVHDVDSLGRQPVQACHIHLAGAQGLTLQGAVDAQGDPATVLAGHNDGVVHGLLPAVLWCEDSPGLTVRDLAFTRSPTYASAGLVTACDGQGIEVEVFADEPCWDGMGAYCMNRCDPATGMLRGASVTFGGGAGTNWRQRGGRRLRLDSPAVAAAVATGEHLSWHQGARTDIQTYFGACHGLHLLNLRTLNANGLAMVTERCRDITAARIILRPDGQRLFTAPRDGWKLYRCSGRIRVSGLEVQGVRMDGQNIHSTWLQREDAASGCEAVFRARYAFAPLESGSILECWQDGRLHQAEIADWSPAGRCADGHHYRIRCTAPLPGGAGLLAAPLCWQPSRYTCMDSTFTSIAGAGHLVRGGRVEIAGCSYRHLMCPGIFLGAETGTHPEGGHVSDVLIRDCSFHDCGVRERDRYDHGPGGCIASGTIGGFDPPDAAYNRGIRIIGNRFTSSRRGIVLRQAADVVLEGNSFADVDEPQLAATTQAGSGS